MAASRLSSGGPKLTRSATPESLFSNLTGDAGSSNEQSQTSSTPPTSAADSASVSSASLKIGESSNVNADAEADADPDANTHSRPRRARTSALGTYNVKALSGTSVHTPKKSRKTEDKQDNGEGTPRHRTISGETLVDALGDGENAPSDEILKEADQLVQDGIEALDLQWSPRKLPRSRSEIGMRASQSPRKSPRKVAAAAKEAESNRRRSTRLAGGDLETMAHKLSVLGKRGRKAFESGLAKGKRELKRLADTNEFAKIETTPIYHTVWANGKLVTEEPAPKKAKIEAPTEKAKEVEEPVVDKKKKLKFKKEKIWLNKGLYAGQTAKYSPGSGKGKKVVDALLQEQQQRTILPLPIFTGERIIKTGRDFKLPFDVCSPLPPGQPKPDEWRKFSKNRFIGDAQALWKKITLFDDFSSRCVCTKQSGCGDSCQNRIMLYECDEGNCSVGREHCTNRAFSDLQERRSKGGKYRIGVEVIKTEDRGYGVRTNRCFDAHQIIVEYTGEIITEEECDRRMNEEYKNNECYYLMSFDQQMIIDATRGSIARFVNHSCEPNCRMVKWIVGGKPRMALFAGDKPLMTGEELTYDYNFDPFSAKNVQECRCGSANCRGVLGPRQRDVKPPKAQAIVENVKKAVSAGKRKLKELLGGETDENDKSKIKKRKIAVPKGKSSSTTAKAVKAAKAVTKKVSKKISKTVNVGTKRGNSVLVKKTKKTVKTYGAVGGKRQTVLSSRNSSLTFVASENGSPKSVKSKGKGAGKGKADTLGKRSVKKNVVRSIKGKAKAAKALGMKESGSSSTIRVVSVAGEEQEA